MRYIIPKCKRQKNKIQNQKKKGKKAMPSGVYQRKPGLKRKINESARQKFCENLSKAWSNPSEKCKEAKKKNASIAHKVKTARSILKRIPLDAVSGMVITGCRSTIKYEIIDPKPVLSSDGISWEQKLRAGGYVILYGIRREFSGVVRITWDYEPTLENIMDRPIYQEDTETEQ
jgi:hypothetical protein